MTPIPEGFKEVTEDEFFGIIYRHALNVHVGQGQPDFTWWREPSGRKWGWSAPGWKFPGAPKTHALRQGDPMIADWRKETAKLQRHLGPDWTRTALSRHFSDLPALLKIRAEDGSRWAVVCPNGDWYEIANGELPQYHGKNETHSEFSLRDLARIRPVALFYRPAKR